MKRLLMAMEKKGTQPRVCFALRSFPKYFLGGAELQSFFVARHMLGKGWSVHFTTDDWGQPTAKLENEDGIWVHKLKRTRFLNPRRCWDFYRELVRMNADIYYQRGGWEYTFVISLAAKVLGGKFVWAVSMAPDCEGNKFRRFLEDEGVKGIKRWMLWPEAWIRDVFVSLGRKRADVIIVQDESQQAMFRQRFGQESVVIKTGHEVPKKPGRKSSPPLVVWVANVKKLKRPEIFIELARACSDLPARFLLVGGRAEPRYRRELTRQGAGLGNLELTWAVPFELTNGLLSAASLLVNTSTGEGFPNTFVQAWLRETPVVSLTADPDSVLARERTGIRSGSFRQMVEDVRRLLSDELLRKRMGERARAYAVREHNLADKLRQYEDLFEKLCGESGLVQSA
jgi:glycosyltransferase involved in cell wall biosynthesis